MEWTEKQREAIETKGKNILVAAAAGSGKTAVLTERILRHVLDDEEYDLSKILVVTFTRAAAAEMRQRLEKKIAERISLLESEDSAEGEQEKEDKLLRLKRQLLLLDSANISTIDSFCQSIIRREGADNDSAVDTQSRIAVEEELQFIKQEVIEDVFLSRYEAEDKEFLNFAAMYGNDNGDDSLYELVLSLVEFAESEPDPDYWLTSLVSDYEGITAELVNGTNTAEASAARAEEWMRCLKKNIAYRMTEIRESIRECIERAEDLDTDKSHAFADFVREEYRAVIDDRYQQLIDDIDVKSWDEIRDFVQGITPIVISKKGTAARAPGFTGDENTKSEIESIKDLRKNAAAALKEVLKGKLLSKDSAEIAKELSLMGGYVKVLAGLAVEFRAKFRQEKQERRIMDFSDIEHIALDIIAKRDGKGGYHELTESGKKIRAQYREIMVDEYQDVNHLQETMFTLLSRSEFSTEEDGENLPGRFIVGDVKQSIYRFRHADPNLFNKKKNIYGESGQDGPCYRVDMSNNYRSRSSVLRAINYIFRQLMVGEGTEIIYDEREALHFTADSANDNIFPMTDKTCFFDAKTELAIIETGVEDSDEQEESTAPKKSAFEIEAAYIAGRIERLLSSGVNVCADNGEYRPIEPRDIVILMRSVNGRTEIIREQLKCKNIRTYVTVDAGYFEALEVNTVVSLMRIIDNAHQDIPLAAVLRSPVGNFTDQELVRLRLFDRQDRYFYDVLKKAAEDNEGSLEAEAFRTEYLDAGLRSKARTFLSKLAGWRKAARELSLGELIWRLLRETNYYEYVGAMPGGQLRQANLRLLIERARAYESGDNHGLFRFLHFIELLKKGKTDLSQARTLGENENVVRIMTIHKSKGMEFPVVILAGMGKQFNTQDEKKTFIYHKELGIGGDIIVTARQLSGDESDDNTLRMKNTSISKEVIRQTLNQEMKAEELRLLYVALTRAKEKLIMTGGVKNFAKAVDGWSKYSKAVNSQPDKETVKPLDERAVMEVKSLLDWVAVALANHSDGVCFHPNDSESMYYCDGSRFSVDVISGAEEAAGETETLESKEEYTVSTKDFLTAVRNRKPLLNGVELDSEANKLAAEIEDLLKYDYPDCGTAGLRAKISVTELKHRVQLEEQRNALDSDLPEAAGADSKLVESEIEFRESSLLGDSVVIPEEKDNGSVYIGGPLFGTAVHGILQQVVLKNIKRGSAELSTVTRDIIVNTIGKKEETLLSRYVLKAERYVNGFLGSDIGKRVMKARSLGKTHCELPFIRLLDVAAVFPEKIQSSKDNQQRLPKIFLQGIIDLLFEEDGRYILLDYKTDRNINGTEAIERYHKQLELYMESIEELTGKKVHEAYLFLLDSQKEVRFYP